MKKEDLIEFLSSVVEEDAIISRLYNLFHIKYEYPIAFLDNLVQFGVKNNFFIIENAKNSDEKYDSIKWEVDNTEQELTTEQTDYFVKSLFSQYPFVPEEFIQFVDKGLL